MPWQNCHGYLILLLIYPRCFVENISKVSFFFRKFALLLLFQAIVLMCVNVNVNV